MRLKQICALALLACACNLCSAVVTEPSQANSPVSAKKEVFLYAQTALKGTIKKNPDGKSYTIMLQGISPITTQFSDRPFRVTAPISTAEFIQRWNSGKNSFKLDNPNAALSYTNNQILRGINVIELSSPRYDEKTKTLIYQATPIGKSVLPNDEVMIKPSVFID